MSFPSLQRALLTHSRYARANRAGKGLRRTLRTRQLRCEPLEDRRMLSISFPDFSDPTGLNLVGDATTTDNVLRLASDEFENGGAWYAEPQLVSVEFETTFDFRLTRASAGSYWGLGFALVIQNDYEWTLGGGLADLGYAWMPNSLAVEVDTSKSHPVFSEAVSDTHLRAHETPEHLGGRLLLEKKNKYK